MNIEDVLALDEFTKIKAELTKLKPDERTDTWIKQYNNENKILKKADKIIEPNTSDGDNQAKKIPYIKIPVSFQDHIVRFAASMLFGKSVKYVFQEAFKNIVQKVKNKLVVNNKVDDPEQLFNDVIYDNKLEYFDRKQARIAMSECRVVEFWYLRQPKIAGENVTIHVQMWAKSLGSNVYPYYDDFGDMIALSREYTVSVDGKSIDCFDIYTAGKTVKAKNIDNVWTIEDEANPYGKIMGVYTEFSRPVWSLVQEACDQYNETVSTFCDSNAYCAHPIIVSKGKIVNPPNKGDAGSMLVLEPEMDDNGKPVWGDVSFLEITNASEAISLELETLKEIIYTKTATVDLAAESLKGAGGAPSGYSMELRFLDPKLMALMHEEIFGASLRRRVSIIKTLLSAVHVKHKAAFEEMKIVPKFQNPLPSDIETWTTLLSLATGGEKIMSQESAVEQNMLLENTEGEFDRIKAEKGDEFDQDMQ